MNVSAIIFHEEAEKIKAIYLLGYSLVHLHLGFKKLGKLEMYDKMHSTSQARVSKYLILLDPSDLCGGSSFSCF